MKDKRQMKKKSNGKWMKYRHCIARNVAYAILYPYSVIKYGIQIVKFKNQGGRAYLVLLNHQTPFDQFFVGISFSGPVYYLATEDIFSLGWVSSLIRWLIAPIPIKKQTTDITAIKNCFRVVKEGGTLCIAPEGNRTYSGKTEYMSSSIAPLAKKLNLPIALYRIEGGYGTQPRWSDVVRKGKMKAYVSKVIEPAEYAKLTNDELFVLIQEGLYVNEANEEHVFKHKKRAEYLERAMYVCPFCGLSIFESKNEIIECQKCHTKVEYTPTTKLVGIDKEFPFSFVNDWYEYQKEFVRKLDLSQYGAAPLYEDHVRLLEVIIRKHKKPLRDDAKINLYGNRIEIDDEKENAMMLHFDDISVIAVLGRNKLNIYHQGKVYQFKGSKRFNALKYVNIFYRYKNMQRGDNDGEFLGL